MSGEKESTSLEKFGVQQPVAIEVKNLIVSSMPRTLLSLGDIDSLASALDARGDVQAIVWNEDRIALLTADRATMVSFAPEIYPTAAMFFSREEKREGRNPWTGEGGIRVWQGDYEPVKFTKRHLIKFLREHDAVFPKELEAAIREMKVTETKSQNEELLDLDSDNVRRVEEELQVTNLPKKFDITLPIADGFSAELHFEASVVPLEDRYGNPTSRRGIELRVTNAREVRKKLMDSILARLPSEVPRLYGSLHTERPRRFDE